MPDDQQEGQDPAARQAAEEWRRRFGREGHEGSYAQHGDEQAERKKDKPSRTSP